MTTKYGLTLPGEVTRVGWSVPKNISIKDWKACGEALDEAEVSSPWCKADWWVAGERRFAQNRAESKELAESVGLKYGSIQVYGSVARAFPDFLSRLKNLTFQHHLVAVTLLKDQKDRVRWLKDAAGAKPERWSAQKLASEIKKATAFARTREAEFNAKKLGKFVVLYADPPWQYENPPMGGSNRSVENHYPTMTLDRICELGTKISSSAYRDSVLFLWATSPKMVESMQVLAAWGFLYRTAMVWVKDKIGMGYYAREQHENLLIAKRGELPPPSDDARPSSVINAPRLKHSAKPPEVRDLLDNMYPDVRKLELFGRFPEKRKNWEVWGNQA